ncbi:MAG: hypothetical protein LBT46_07435 [Planctomycetaceae bacterium]|nr:hypothetical protein [Planctomycetaceae bacterium]
MSIKLTKIIRYFCEDITAVFTAVIIGVNRRAVDSWDIREQIFAQTLKEIRQELGGIELDKSYLWNKAGTRQARSRCGRFDRRLVCQKKNSQSLTVVLHKLLCYTRENVISVSITEKKT